MKMKHKRMRLAKGIRKQAGLHFCDAIKVARALINIGSISYLKSETIVIEKVPFGCGLECCGFETRLITEKGKFTVEELFKMSA